MSQNVFLDCSFVDRIFTSDRALECFKHQDVLFLVIAYGYVVERQSLLELELETTLQSCSPGQICPSNMKTVQFIFVLS